MLRKISTLATSQNMSPERFGDFLPCEEKRRVNIGYYSTEVGTLFFRDTLSLLALFREALRAIFEHITTHYRAICAVAA